MKYYAKGFFLLFLLTGCTTTEWQRNPGTTESVSQNREHRTLPSRQEEQEQLSESDKAFSCLVKNPGEIWMKPYEVFGRFFEPMSDCQGFAQKGTASWYGDDFHGKKTSNGEIFDMNRVSAAHKTLPLGIHIRVTNQANGKTIVVRVNDRGPYAKERVLDLSRAAARELGYYEAGTAPVLIEALGYPIAKTDSVPFRPATPSRILLGSGPEAGEFLSHQINPRYFVQVGAFENRNSASVLLTRVRSRFPGAVMEQTDSQGRLVYCIRVKNFTSRQEADRARLDLATAGFPGGLIILEGFTVKS